MSLKDIAISGVETAGPDATVEMVANTMAEKRVGSVVITEESHVVGIVTDRDITLTLASGTDPATTAVAAVMTAEPMTMPLSAGVFELTERMRSATVRRVPVVDDEGVLVGIVTLDDVVRLLSAELDNLAAVIDEESA